MKCGIRTLAIAMVYCTHATIAALAPYCPTNNVCFQWGVPEAAVQSGVGDIYFQIKAPTTYSWVGLGTGSRMGGSKMFIVYTDGNGNMTLSHRDGTGHTEPTFSANDGVYLMEGSMANSSGMIANIRCSSCGFVNLQDTSSWIAAWKQGPSLDSVSSSEHITEHDGERSFNVNLASAVFNATRGPFDGTPESGGGVVSSGGMDNKDDSTLAYAHGILMSVVFVIAYPIGAVAMALLGKWKVHAGWQSVTFAAMWAGFGIGYVLAQDEGEWWNNTHVKMGTVVCSLLVIQPILGWLHHRHYIRHGESGLMSYAHTWYGRSLMVVGIVNGGLGLQLSGASRSLNVAYAVVAAAFGVLYMAGVVVKHRGRNRKAKHALTESGSSSNNVKVQA